MTDKVRKVSRRQFFERSAGASAAALVTAPPALASNAAPASARQALALKGSDQWFSNVPAGRSVVRASHAMVATQPTVGVEVGLDMLKRGGNAVDAAIAMAAVLNVTEPNMTGVGGDAFMMVYSAKTKKLEGLNASGRAPRALNLDYFT